MKKTISQKRIKELVFSFSCLIYPIIIFLIFYVGVNINAFAMSFQDWSFTEGYTFLKTDVFKHYRQFATDLLNSPLLTTALKNSIIWLVIPLVVGFPLGVIFPYLLFAKVPGHSIYRTVAMLPQIISGFITVILVKKFIEGALPSLVLQMTGNANFPNIIKKYPMFSMLFCQIWMGALSGVIVTPNVWGRVSDEIFESAKIDGMDNMWQEWWYILFPMSFDVMSVGWITSFAGLLGGSGLLIPFYGIDAPQELYTVGYYFYVKAVGASSDAGYTYLAAGGILLSAIMIPLTFGLKYVLEKYGPSTD